MHVDLPHFSFPFGRDAEGKVAVVEQDTTEHIMCCVNVITYCPRGWREERPEFGWEFPEFKQHGVGATNLEIALSEFEPRATTTLTEKELEELADKATREISVDVEAG